MITRKDIAFYLDDIETPLGRSIALTLMGLILISSAAFVAETYPIPDTILTYLRRLDTVIIIAFTIEYVIRLCVSDNFIKFIFSPLPLIDLLVILSFYLGLFNFVFILIFRWFRILRLIRFFELEFLIFRIKTEDGVILAQIIFTLFAISFIFSGLIYQVEHPINPQLFRNFLDAFYFSVVTMTTVGFGDVTPMSEMGRCLTLLMIMTGIAVIPWQVREFIEQLLKTTNHVSTLCSGCGLSSHDADAQFCKQCGTQLDKDLQSPPA